MIQDPFNEIGNYIPSSVTQCLNGTIFEEYYHTVTKLPLYARWRIRNTEFVNVRLPVGDEMVSVSMPRNSSMAKRNLCDGTHEPGLTEALATRVGSSDVFYDIGSHYGIISKKAVKAGVDPSNIHAFDNNSYRREVFKRNLPNSVHLCGKTVGPSDRIREITLDSYSKQTELPTAIKIDVEGAEYNVLRGARRILEEQGPLLLVEIHLQWLQTRFSTSTNDLLSLLFEKGYTVECIDHRKSESEWKTIESKDADLEMVSSTPLICAQC